MSEDPSGIVVVDKPGGMTSHDVVARARRLLGTRRIGHAGTLDPMATGVLVLLVGEATKLGPYLTAHDKRYEARVAFGVATDTLDREGKETARAEVPAWLEAELRAAPRPRILQAVAQELARTEQVPPVFSAIHVDGQRSHDLARAGLATELAPRPVEVREIAITGASAAPGEAPYLDLAIAVSKGYYVRSLARDLGDRLGVPAHLAALRRTASGPFAIVDGHPLERDALRTGLVPLDVVARTSLPIGRLTEDGTRRARCGQPISLADFTEPPPSGGDPTAWLDPRERLVAIGARLDPTAEHASDRFVIHRGFTS